MKKFKRGRDSYPCLPDNSWVLLLTALQSHMLGEREILVSHSFPYDMRKNVSYFDLRI